MKELSKERLEELLNECIGYISELGDEQEYSQWWTNVLGFTNEEIDYFGIKI